MRLKHPDLALATAIALANVVWAFLPFRLPVIGTILALPLVFIAPGYTLTGALFHRRSLDRAYRLLLSLGISVSIVIAGGLVLNALPGGLRPSSWSALLAFLTLLFAGLVAYLRRKTAMPASPPDTGTRFIASAFSIVPTPDPTPASVIPSTPHAAPASRMASLRLRWHGWIVCALAVLVMALSIVFSASSVAQQPHAGFTQFWMLPSNQPGEGCTLRLGIQSYELTSETYRIAITASGAEVYVWPFIQLAPRQRWDQSVSIRSNQSGPVYIEARLYLVNNPQVVYREVNVIIYVTKNCGLSRGKSRTTVPIVFTMPVILSAAKNLLKRHADSERSEE